MDPGELKKSAALNETVGRLLLVGFEGREPDELEEIISAVRPAGLIFFARNYPERGGPAALRRLLERARKLAEEILGRPLLLAIDHEGGAVLRLPAPYTALPAPGAIAGLDEAGRLTELGARELAATGFNFNLAPALDLPDGPESFIGVRGFSGDPARAAEWGRTALAALRRAGLIGAAKHFPGLGSARLDPHYEEPTISTPAARLSETDILPYRELSGEADLVAVMSSHARYPALDPERPATFSRPIMGLLKNELGFRGAALTDDLEMGAIKYPLGEAATEAVAAGHDLALICRRRAYIDEARQALASAVRSGRLTPERLADASGRLERLFDRLKAIAVPAGRTAEWFAALTGEMEPSH